MDPGILQVEDLHKQSTNPMYGAWSHPRTIDGAAICLLFGLDMGGFGKFTQSLIKLEDGYVSFYGYFKSI